MPQVLVVFNVHQMQAEEETNNIHKVAHDVASALDQGQSISLVVPSNVMSVDVFPIEGKVDVQVREGEQLRIVEQDESSWRDKPPML